jgi:hypothetical protein
MPPGLPDRMSEEALAINTNIARKDVQDTQSRNSSIQPKPFYK